MCTVTVNVDEAMLKEINPNLSDKTAIRKWVQQLIDLRIREYALQQDVTVEKLYDIIEEEIDSIYANG
jgi:hypothetical protein